MGRNIGHLKLGGRLVPTGGDGLWSDEQTKVKVLWAEICYYDEEEKFAELRVKFDTKTWNTNELGLIYTDRMWLREFRNLLMKKGFSKSAANDADYSEQGMQGDDYVSMDVGRKFLKEWAGKGLALWRDDND